MAEFASKKFLGFLQIHLSIGVTKKIIMLSMSPPVYLWRLHYLS